MGREFIIYLDRWQIDQYALGKFSLISQNQEVQTFSETKYSSFSSSFASIYSSFFPLSNTHSTEFIRKLSNSYPSSFLLVSNLHFVVKRFRDLCKKESC